MTRLSGPAKGRPSTASPFAQRSLFWLTVGLFFGGLDGVLSLGWTPMIAGGWWDRILSILFTMLVDGLAIVVLAHLLTLPALLLARLSRPATEPWMRSMLALAIPCGIALVLLRERHPFGKSLTAIAIAVAVACVVSLLAAAPLARLRWMAAPYPGQQRSLQAIGAVLLIAAVTALGLGPGRGTGRAPHEKRPNIVLISIDTLRADHLSAYGYEHETTPHLDELAREGVLFETAYSPAYWTLPSHASMLTGLDPVAHGAQEGHDRLTPEHTMLAERLAPAGYWNGAWVGMRPFSYVGAKRLFDQGFELYLHRPHPRRYRSGLLIRTFDHIVLKYLHGGVGNATDEIDSVRRFLSQNPPQPFFLFLHFYDVHSKFDALPYAGPEPYLDRFCPGDLTDFDGCFGDICGTHFLGEMMTGKVPRADAEELAKIICLYDGAIAYVDHELGRLFDSLAELGLKDNTVVVVTADHGESFFEHGKTLHKDLYDETTRIPMIFRVPGGPKGRRAGGIARLIDLVPTILELTGTAATGPPLQGQSLAPVLAGDQESGPEEAFNTAINTLVLRRGHLKYFRHGIDPDRDLPSGLPPEELYDLAVDPAEQMNLVTDDNPLLASLRDEVMDRKAASELIRQQVLGGEQEDDFELPPDEIERLKALGYLN